MTKRIIATDAPINELLGKLNASETEAETQELEERSEQHTPYRTPTKVKTERKTTRLQLVLKPSVVKELKAKCKKLGMSVNDYVGQLIEISLEDK